MSKTGIRGVIEHPPGSKIFWVQYFDAQGKRRREKAGHKSAAITLLNKRRAEKLEQKENPAAYKARKRVGITFKEIAEDALKHSAQVNSPAHTKELALKVDLLLSPFGDRKADSITRQEIIKWLGDIKAERKWSDSTRNRYQAAISMVFSHAIETEKVAVNPAARIKRLTENNIKMAFISPAEEKTLRDAIQKLYPQFLPAFTIAIDTGMRASEQFGLKWTQVDLERGILTLPKTKSGKPHRIKLTPDALDAFKTLSEAAGGNELVFADSEGKPIMKHRQWFDRVLLEAGLKGRYTWHDLRHAFASRLVEAGVDLRTVAAMMNHATIQMTMRYSHLAPDHQQDAINRLSAVTARVERQQCATKLPSTSVSC